MYETLVVQAFRPDNLHAMMRRFVLAVMGENFLHEAEQEMDMPNVVEHEVRVLCNDCLRFNVDFETVVGRHATKICIHLIAGSPMS